MQQREHPVDAVRPFAVGFVQPPPLASVFLPFCDTDEEDLAEVLIAVAQRRWNEVEWCRRGLPDCRQRDVRRGD
ncbi:MAG: hypothetical protein ACLP5E_20515 [Streptosporangiaceae bacterium]